MPTPSTAITPETQATFDQLWLMVYALTQNWQKEVILRRSFSTDISVATSDGEHRRGLQGKPTMSQELMVRAMSRTFSQQLQNAMMRMGQARSMQPLVSDQATLQVSTSGLTLQCDTLYKRFQVGNRVMVYDEGKRLLAIRNITAVTPTQISIDSNLVDTYSVDSLILPIFEARGTLGSGGTVLTDSNIESSISGIELPGVWTFSATAAIGTIPSGIQQYGGLPILPTDVDYSTNPTFEITRSGSYEQSGISQEAAVYGSRPRIGYVLPFKYFERQLSWRLINFFDSRGGRLLPFWVVAPTTDFETVSISGSTIVVKSNGPVRDWDLRTHLAILAGDGTVQIRKIIGIIRASGNDTVTMDGAVTMPADLVRVSDARLSRFDTDEMTETWTTDRAMTTSLKTIELTKEESVVIANMKVLTARGLSSVFIPGTDSGSSGVTVPMHFLPCNAPSERPVVRAADLTMPQFIQIQVLAEFEIDPAFPVTSGVVSDELLEAVPDAYTLAYIGTANGPSHHWHHAYVDSGLNWNHQTNSNGCFRHVWRTTKTYTGADSGTKTITVEAVAEFANHTNGSANGVVFHVYVYSSEVNPSYVDGVADPSRGNRVFSANNPAVWGWILGAGLHDDEKFCHPRMLICASVPTSMEALCGDQGTAGCNNALIRAGFDLCFKKGNGSPWILNDPLISPGNIVFGETGSWYGAISLGGDCPTSEMFEHLIVENRQGLGITALKPLRSGWKEATGELDLEGGSSVELNVCLPSQAANIIDCCNGHPLFPLGGVGGTPNCWRPLPDAPPPCDPPDLARPDDRACFSTTEPLEVEISQKCICCYHYYGPPDGMGGCTEITTGVIQFSVCYSDKRNVLLKPCAATYLDSGGDRQFSWEAWFRDQNYPTLSFNINFASGALAPAQGAWLFNVTPGEATCDTAGASTTWPCLAFEGSFPIVNGHARTTCEAACEQGIVFRATTNTASADAYRVSAAAATGVLKIEKVVGGVVTLLAQLTGLTIPTPYYLHAYFDGESFQAAIDDDPDMVVSAKDCELKDGGYVGLYGKLTSCAQLRFTDFLLEDLPPEAMQQFLVVYNNGGWAVTTCPAAFPYYGPTAPCIDQNPDCGTDPTCYCTRIAAVQEPTPGTITYAQSNFYPTPPSYNGGAWADQDKPYPGHGGFGRRTTCCGPYPLAPFLDFPFLKIRAKTCRGTPCPEVSVDTSRGFDIWYGTPKVCGP